MDVRNYVAYYEYEKTCESQRSDMMWYAFWLCVQKSTDRLFKSLQNCDITTVITNLYGLEELAALNITKRKILYNKDIILLSCLAHEPEAIILVNKFPNSKSIYWDHNNPCVSMSELKKILS